MAEFDAATRGMLAQQRVPFPGLLSPFKQWWERRHLELLAEEGYDDVRLAHNAVFVHLPARGMRLTELADAAGMSKQAMAELVDDLVDKGYIRKEPDPTDGRAKILVWDRRGLESYEATMAAFGRLEDELREVLGSQRLEELRSALTELVAALH